MPTIMSSNRKKADPSRSAETKRQESEEQLSLLQTITSELAAADNLSSALEVVLRDVCEKTGWILGHAWVPNRSGTALDLASARSEEHTSELQSRVDISY